MYRKCSLNGLQLHGMFSQLECFGSDACSLIIFAFNEITNHVRQHEFLLHNPENSDVQAAWLWDLIMKVEHVIRTVAKFIIPFFHGGTFRCNEFLILLPNS